MVCKSELEEEGLLAGKFCSSSWDITMENCNEHYKEDKDCPVSNQWCYWVECPNGDEEGMMEEPTTEATKPSCNAEVRRCPNGQFVGRAQQLNCDFYSCPDGAVEEEGGGGGAQEMAVNQASSNSDSSNLNFPGWGSTPLRMLLRPTWQLRPLSRRLQFRHQLPGWPPVLLARSG